MTRKKRKKRVRAGRHPAERPHFLGNDEARFRLAWRLSLTLGVILILTALTASSAMPAWNRTLGAHGNVALRVAGIALVIVAMMFRRLGKGK